MDGITIIWKMEWLKLKSDTVPTLGYVDFQVDGIDGVFRAAHSDGVDLEKVVSRIRENQEFFSYLCNVGVRQVFGESKTKTNWGNGWEWQETKHPKQARGFRLDSCTSWFTCPFGGNSPDVVEMDKIHGNIQSDGVKLLYSWDSNRSPVEVCYFFPFTKVAAPLAAV